MQERTTPDAATCAAATAKALAHRLARHTGAPVPLDACDVHWSTGAAGEGALLRVRGESSDVWGFTVPPREGSDGWWCVGRIVDERAQAVFSVWFMPGGGGQGPHRIGISRRHRPAAPDAPQDAIAGP